MGAEEPGGRGLAPHRKDAGALHQVGDPDPGAVGLAGSAGAAGRIRDRHRAPARHAQPGLRPDRRVLPDGRPPAEQLPLLRERVLPQGVRTRPPPGAAHQFHIARPAAGPHHDRGLPEPRGRSFAAGAADPDRPGAAAAGRDQPRGRVLRGVRDPHPGNGRDRVFPRRHRARRPHRVQRAGIRAIIP